MTSTVATAVVVLIGYLIKDSFTGQMILGSFGGLLVMQAFTAAIEKIIRP